MEIASSGVVPVAPHRDEALPLVLDPRRGQGLGGGDQDQVLGLVEPRLELAHPGAAAAQVDAVEEHPAGSAGPSDSGPRADRRLISKV